MGLRHVQSVSALLINPDGKLLLQQRDNRPSLRFPGHWTTFGGAIERGETPERAMRRELHEEIGFAPEMIFWKTVSLAQIMAGEQVILDIYVFVGHVDRPLEKIDVHEGQGAGFFDVSDLDGIPIAFGFELLFREFFALREVLL